MWSLAPPLYRILPSILISDDNLALPWTRSQGFVFLDAGDGGERNLKLTFTATSMGLRCVRPRSLNEPRSSVWGEPIRPDGRPAPPREMDVGNAGPTRTHTHSYTHTHTHRRNGRTKELGSLRKNKLCFMMLRRVFLSNWARQIKQMNILCF